MLIPHMGHVSPRFHVKFDDFFEMVQHKPTDLDAPDPESKYLSSFAVRKGLAKSGVKGVLDSLLAPQRGPTTATTIPLPPNEPVQPADQWQDLQIPAVDDDIESNLLTLPQPAHQTAPSCLSRSWNIHRQWHARHAAAESYATPLAMNKASPNEARDL